MNPDRKALARRLVVGLSGPGLLPAETAWLQMYQPAGVILFGRNVVSFAQVKRLCAVLRTIVPDLEIMADHEGGPVSVLAAAIGRPPAPWSLGALNDPGLTRLVHAQTGHLLGEVGIDRVLGPCCDVLVEPRNPVIGARAFGAAPAQVAEQVAAAVSGLVESGICATLKHWPGHGGSATDSHDGAVTTGAGALAAPFTAGRAAGADGLMVGHLPILTPGLPATLDPEAISAARSAIPDAGVAGVAGDAGATAGVTLFADDVTMGSLRPAMDELGVPLPDDLAQGLVEPEHLSPAWLQKLVDAGCDRLLIRGIPVGALPVSPSDRDIPGPAWPDESAETDRVQSAPSYEQVRDRCAEAINWPGLPCAETDLLWLDATAGDRWGEAKSFNSLLHNRFQSVTHVPIDTLTSSLPHFDVVLVTSHRPLTAISRQNLDQVLSEVPERRSGEILLMGHPSLWDDLKTAQQPIQCVSKLFDVHELDLESVLRKNS